MSNNKNVVKFNRDIKVNAATCLIAAILLYVIICVIIAARKEPITTYKVNKSNISNNITLEGLAIRDEEVINTTKSGYICYYIRDGEKIQKNSTVCSVDESGQIYNVISDVEEYDDLLSKEDYDAIRSLISLYKVSYNDSSFYEAYNFENNLNNKVLELNNEILMQQITTESGSTTLTGIYSPYSGLVTYYIDGFENYNISSINQDAFDKSKYSKQTLKTGDIISTNSPIVKIIPSEKWNIVAPISQEQIAAISDSSYINFKINNSSYEVYMPYEIINGSDGTYINISLDKYMSNFVSERYLTIEIIKKDDTGLKIPVSAIVDKDVYKIPIDYFSAGSNQSNANRINIQVLDENGEITIKQIAPTIYDSDEEYCYVNPLDFSDTDVLLNINSNQTIAVSLLSTNKIQGVYSANRGTAEFKKITVIKTVDEFALIESDEELKIYDNIVLDSSTVTENQIIY